VWLKSLEVKVTFVHHAFRNEYLSFSVVESHLETVALNLKTVSRVENVADSLAIAERVVSHLTLLLVFGISQCNKELSSRECVEVVVNIVFLEALVPDLGALPSLVDLGDLLVKRRLSVEVVPEYLSVVRVITSAVVLFGPIVDEWDTSASHRENNGTGESHVVSVVVEESSIVMVVNKHA
jgi:hypothetical protein